MREAARNDNSTLHGRMREAARNDNSTLHGRLTKYIVR